MPVDQGLDQLAAVQFVVIVGVVHLEVVELQLLLGHFAGVQGHFHVLGNVTVCIETKPETRECFNITLACRWGQQFRQQLINNYRSLRL